MVDMDFWKSPAMTELVDKMRREYLHDIKVERWKLTAYYSKVNRNQLDLWPYEVTWRHDRRIVSISHSSWVYTPVEYILPPKSVLFSGLQVSIPAKPKLYLDVEKGAGKWQREISCHIIVNDKCQ